MVHVPVLTKEVLELLNPGQNKNFVDCTIGEGGHTILILEKNKPLGKVLGIDLDSGQIENCKLTIKDQRLILINDSYINIKEIIEKINFGPVNGILLDLGYSSWQLEKAMKGFSFQRDEALDMRYNGSQLLTAEKIINEYPEAEIERILQEYGEERFSRQIANKITNHRKIKKIQTTFELKDIIEKAIPARFRQRDARIIRFSGNSRPGKIHFATRSFQAIRIAVNGELDNLTRFLPEAISVLTSNGRLVVISFHSLEDRIVKNFFKNQLKKGTIKILTKKPIIASKEELLINPKARSAKLRALEYTL